MTGVKLNLEGKVALITGGSRGIGAETVRLFAAAGARVAFSYRQARDRATALSLEGGGPERCTALEQELSSPADGRALVGAAVRAFGRLDVLINNAGIIEWAGLPDADVENLERHLAVHVLGSFNTTRAAWPLMVGQGYGRIVMTTSSGPTAWTSAMAARKRASPAAVP